MQNQFPGKIRCRAVAVAVDRSGIRVQNPPPRKRFSGAVDTEELRPVPRQSQTGEQKLKCGWTRVYDELSRRGKLRECSADSEIERVAGCENGNLFFFRPAHQFTRLFKRVRSKDNLFRFESGRQKFKLPFPSRDDVGGAEKFFLRMFDAHDVNPSVHIRSPLSL